MMTVADRIRTIRLYEMLKEMYENGNKNVIKTGDYSYKQIGPAGETIIEVRGF